jgi:hypothetical protein
VAFTRLVRTSSVLLRRNAIYKGFLGGSRGWKVVGAIIFGRRFAKRTFGRNEQIIATEKLRKGQFVRIEAFGPPTRRERRAARQVE